MVKFAALTYNIKITSRVFSIIFSYISYVHNKYHTHAYRNPNQKKICPVKLLLIEPSVKFGNFVCVPSLLYEIGNNIELHIQIYYTALFRQGNVIWSRSTVLHENFAFYISLSIAEDRRLEGEMSRLKLHQNMLLFYKITIYCIQVLYTLGNSI